MVHIISISLAAYTSVTDSLKCFIMANSDFYINKHKHNRIGQNPTSVI